ncbi:hypothetical protein DYB38_001402 [Aphanomyces astaci]|uniref:[acyl-carrier-protein] S-malonyltransferase n=1 Tax=Aphanomyces astaci TaxID=112090 RepID=A0A397C7R6_APHAT|nr:hypothetical protein DYB38_001402 [Aphanomyces astaci]
MLQDLLDQWPQHVNPLLEEAEAAMKRNLKTLMLQGPQDALTNTSIAQPAILTHSTAVLRILQREADFDVASEVHSVLGHSLGQFTALVAAEALSFHDAIDLVVHPISNPSYLANIWFSVLASPRTSQHFRGNAMTKAIAGSDKGAMAALFPVDPAVANDICHSVHESTGLVCSVANYNSSKQVTVISGHFAAVEAAVAAAKSRKVRRAVLLDVSAPFHCALMQPAADALAAHLNTITFRPPIVPVVCNVSAVDMPGTDADAMRAALTAQVVQPVRWSESVDLCIHRTAPNDHTTFLELGYGGVLTGLIQQHAPTAATCTSMGTADDVRKWIAARELEA